jgi:hypothetical protein
MNRNSISYSSLLLLSALLSPTGAHAQSTARANVPFAFTVGTKQMPAGTYTLRNKMGSNVIMVHNAETGRSALVMGRWEAPTKKTDKLIFRRYGAQYYLTAIVGSQGSQGMVFPVVRQEKNLQEAAQAPASGANNVEIASR